MQDDSQSQGISVDQRLDAYHTPEAPQPAVAEQQPAPMPSANEEPTDVVAPSPEGDDLSLPEGVSDRTKQQFDKLKARLKDAEAKLAAPQADYGSSVFDTFRPKEPIVPTPPSAQNFQFLNQQQVDAIATDYVDQYGNVDVNGLNQALRSANQRAQDAEKRVRSVEDKLTRFEESRQTQEAHAVYPELAPLTEDGKPNPQFDPSFFEAVRDRLLRKNFIEGGNTTLLQAAREVRKFVPGTKPVNETQVAQDAVTQYEQAQAARNQGPLASGKGETRQPTVTYDELRERTRRGDDDALAERLKSVGILK